MDQPAIPPFSSRIVSVIARPTDDGLAWEIEVDYSSMISPYEAFGMLTMALAQQQALVDDWANVGDDE